MFFDRRGAVAMGVLFAIALAIRLVHLGEISDHPFFEYPTNDAKAYDDWAKRIADGEWWGSEAFYQAPAYPYLLAIVYRVGGHDLGLAHVAQMVMGALSCVLIFGATRVLFGWGAGVAAAGILAVYGPAIGFEGILGKQSLGLLLTSSLLLALVLHQVEPRARTALSAGLAIGLLSLTRENALIFAVAVPLWMLWRHWDHGVGALSRWVGALALGLILTLGLVATRNYAVGQTFALTTSQLGPNFFIGNNADATGLYEPLVPGHHTPVFESPDATRIAERALGRRLTRGEVSNYWLELGLDFVRDQPVNWLLLMLKKLMLTWNEFEIGDTEDLYIYAEDSRVLGLLLPIVHFGWLVPLAAVGVVMGWSRRRDFALLLWLAAAFSGGVALFMVFARMRYPLVALLLPLAGLGVASVSATLRRRDAAGWGPALLAFASTGLLVNLPLLPESAFKSTGYTNIAGILLQHERASEAESYLVRARSLGVENPNLDFNFAVLRLEQGRLEEAEAHLHTMLALSPEDPRGHRLLSIVLSQAGRPEEAAESRRSARRLDPSLDLRRRSSRPGDAAGGVTPRPGGVAPRR